MGTPIRFVRLIFQSAVLAVGNDIAALPILRDFISQLDEGCERLPIAQANELILVTDNTKHFQRIPNLQLENWLND